MCDNIKVNTHARVYSYSSFTETFKTLYFLVSVLDSLIILLYSVISPMVYCSLAGVSVILLKNRGAFPTKERVQGNIILPILGRGMKISICTVQMEGGLFGLGHQSETECYL